MVDIKLIRTKSQIKNFFKFADFLYANCPIYVPSYYKNNKQLFNHRKNPNLNSNEIIGFLAYQENRVVGRVLGIINRVERLNQSIVRLYCFDFINDSEVSFGLMNEIEKWALYQKITTIVCELGFNDLNSIGLVYKSDNSTYATYQSRYNFDYYIEHLKNYGFVASKKFSEYALRLKHEFDVDDADISINKQLSQNNLRFVEGDKKFKIAMYGRKIFDLLYENSISGYPTVIDDKVYNKYLKTINKMFDANDLIILVNENDEVVASMLITNNTSLALQTTKGKVLSSKLMYTIGGDFEKEYDISWLIFNKKYCNSACTIFSCVLGKMALTGDMGNIYTNIWLNCEQKRLIFNQVFDMQLIRSRAIYTKNLINSSKPIIKKSTEDLCAPNNIGTKSSLK